MIFTTGAIVCIFGWLLINFCGTANPFQTTTAELVGAFLLLSGLLGMIGSVLVLAWQYLP